MNRTQFKLASRGLAVVAASHQLGAVDTALRRSATGRVIQVRRRGGFSLQRQSLAVTVRISLFSVIFNDDCLIDMTFLFVYSN